MGKWSSKEEYNSYMREYLKKSYDRRMSSAILSLGGKCVHCSSTVDLQFDHIDPSSKYKNISALTTASKAIFENEVKKCQLLCKECHQLKSIEEGSFHNDVFKNIKCDLCKRDFPSRNSFNGHKAFCK